MMKRIKESEKNNKLFAGEWIFDDTGRLAYKLDKQGALIFNCAEDVTQEEKLAFTVEALIHLGVDENKAIELATHVGPKH